MKESLQIEPSGDNFVLQRTDSDGHVTQIVLSEDNVLTLAQSTQPLTDRILARRSRSRTAAVKVTEVARIRLSTDIHEAEVFFGLVDRHGAEMIFSLSPDFAQQLIDHLPAWVAKTVQSPKTKQ